MIAEQRTLANAALIVLLIGTCVLLAINLLEEPPERGSVATDLTAAGRGNKVRVICPRRELKGSKHKVRCRLAGGLPPGETGPDGLQGPEGPQGAIGPEGPEGDQGIPGVQGVPGPTAIGTDRASGPIDLPGLSNVEVLSAEITTTFQSVFALDASVGLDAPGVVTPALAGCQATVSNGPEGLGDQLTPVFAAEVSPFLPPTDETLSLTGANPASNPSYQPGTYTVGVSCSNISSSGVVDAVDRALNVTAIAAP